MKYEDILAWRQDVYEQTVLVAQMVPRTEFRDETYAPRLTSPAKPAWVDKEAVQKPLPKKPEVVHQEVEEWPALPSVSDSRDKRKSLPLPGGVSPADMVNDVNDLSLRRVPRHDERYAFDWMTNNIRSNMQIKTDPIARIPTPVPAALAPAQGHATPKILKRPVSGSFSHNQGQAKSAMYGTSEDTRQRSTTESSMDRSSSASAVQYAYGMSDMQEAVPGQASTEDEYGPVTPTHLMNEAVPRMMNDYALDDLADARQGQRIAVPQYVQSETM